MQRAAGLAQDSRINRDCGSVSLIFDIYIINFPDREKASSSPGSRFVSAAYYKFAEIRSLRFIDQIRDLEQVSPIRQNPGEDAELVETRLESTDVGQIIVLFFEPRKVISKKKEKKIFKKLYYYDNITFRLSVVI